MPGDSNRKRPRAADGKSGSAGRPGKANKPQRGSAAASAPKPRSKALEEDVLLDDGSDDGLGFDDDDGRQDEQGSGEVLAPEDLETADEKRLRMAKSFLQGLTRQVAKQRVGGAETGDGDDLDVDAEESESEDEEEARGITRADTFDAVAEKLRARALSASGSLIRPVSSVITGHAWGPADVLVRKGHELPATCMAVSHDGRYVYTGSKDCSIVRWRVEMPAWEQARQAAQEAEHGQDDSSSDADGASDAGAGGRAVNGATAHAPGSGSTLPATVLVKDATYPGRRRTKADVERQKAQVAASKKGKGVIPVYGPGFGGGRAGPTAGTQAGAGAGAADGAGAAGAGGPRIMHSQGTSTLIVPSKASIGLDGAPTGMSKKAVTMARLRGLPDYGIQGHWAEVLTLAVSTDGQYLASGGKDRVVRLWEATPPYVPTGAGASPAGAAGSSNSGSAGAAGEVAGAGASSAGSSSSAAAGASSGPSTRPSGPTKPKQLGVASIDNFVGHKDSVTGVAWRPGSHELVSVGADRLLKLWSADELSHIDTLFGHQSDITAVDYPPSGKERAVTASRDHTAQLFKIPEASRLVFRGSVHDVSLEAVRVITDSYFVTGSQDGSLHLWHVSRKKPVASVLLAHGTGINVPRADEHAPAAIVTEAQKHVKGDGGGAAAVLPAGALARSEDGPAPSADTLATMAQVTGADPEGLSSGYCNWVTAIAVLPNSDVLATGSGDGFVRFWRLAGKGGAAVRGSAGNVMFTSLHHIAAVPVQGIVTGLAFSSNGKYLAASVGSEHRLGRWWRYKVKNGPVLIRLPQLLEEAGAAGKAAGAAARAPGASSAGPRAAR